MAFQMKIYDYRTTKMEPSIPVPAKSRFQKFFERRNSDRETESGSPGLGKLVACFIEASQALLVWIKCRCNCFGVDFAVSSDDEVAEDCVTMDALDSLKGLMLCRSVTERNLLAHVSQIIEVNKSKTGEGKAGSIKFVIENLKRVGYDASIRKSKWDWTTSIPSGEYDYIEVNINSDRFIVYTNFRAEFEIEYGLLLQCLPSIYVGKPSRIDQIITIVSEAAEQSFNQKELHIPPWRRLEYMKAKWLAPYEMKMDSKLRGVPKVSGEFKMEAVGSVNEKTKSILSWSSLAVKAMALTRGGKSGLSYVVTVGNKFSFYVNIDNSNLNE